MKRWLVLAAALAFASGAVAQTATPFIAPAAPKPKIVRLLAPADSFEQRTLDEYERVSGFQVAYDAYVGAADLAEKTRDGPYDLVVLPGPALARQIGLNALARLDKLRAPNARLIQPIVAAKLAAYDPSGAYAVPLGWFAIGLVYDAEKVAGRLGGPPTSWGNLFVPQLARKLDDCGIVTPDDRDALFIAAWRMLGVDPARASPLDGKNAGALLARTRPVIRAFAAPDVAGALASGAACLAVGDEGVAEAATARSREGGASGRFAFVLPREGGALALYAFAIPLDAPNAEAAYALLDLLLRPDLAGRDAQAARLVSALAPGHDDALRRSWPEGAYDPRAAGAIEAEWARLRAAK